MGDINFRRLMRKAIESEWCIAYRNKKTGGILIDKRHCFSLIKNTLRYWCADPFPVEEGEKNYIFFEAFDRIKRKGAIGYREITGNKISKLKIVIEEPFHLSYPYIYCENGSWYIIPESKDSHQIIRYKAKEFPDVWEREKILIDNIPAVDTTVISYNNNDMILFTYLFESFNKGILQIIKLNETSESVIHKIADVNGTKRPAGKIFEIGNFRYRPSQLCTTTYGEAIIFNKILDFTDSAYTETEYKMVSVADICLERAVKICGVHTYNSSKSWEVIDVEIREFSILRILGLVHRIYHRIKRSLNGKQGFGENTKNER